MLPLHPPQKVRRMSERKTIWPSHLAHLLRLVQSRDEARYVKLEMSRFWRGCLGWKNVRHLVFSLLGRKNVEFVQCKVQEGLGGFWVALASNFWSLFMQSLLPPWRRRGSVDDLVLHVHTFGTSHGIDIQKSREEAETRIACNGSRADSRSCVQICRSSMALEGSR